MSIIRSKNTLTFTTLLGQTVSSHVIVAIYFSEIQFYPEQSTHRVRLQYMYETGSGDELAYMPLDDITYDINTEEMSLDNLLHTGKTVQAVNAMLSTISVYGSQPDTWYIVEDAIPPIA